MPRPRRRSRGTATRLLSGLVVASFLAAALRAGTPPNLLDDNRSDFTLEAIETTAINLAMNLAGFFTDPLTFTYPPVVISGRVLAHPKIHNLYLDDDWDANNPDAPTKAQLDAFTQELVSSGYLSSAGQYGVGSATFTGHHERSVLCIPRQPLFGHAEFVELMKWVACEVGLSLPVPGLIPPLTGVPKADDDTLYVVYLPRSMTIVDGGCDSLSAYHFFGAAPDIQFVLFVPVPVSQTFAFAVVPTACAEHKNPSPTAEQIRDSITTSASHEILEAATDPLVGTGWINNSVVTDLHGSFFSDMIQLFSNISTDLKVGEAADICQDSANPQRGAPAFQNPTPPISLPVTDPSLGTHMKVAAYWSNQPDPGGCAPFVPNSKLTFGTPSFGSFVTSSTVLTITADDGGSGQGVASVSYRYYPQGTAPPAFTTVPPPASFSLSGPDGPYTIDLFATGNNNITEVVHSQTAKLDNTPPVITIVSPTATQYAHSDTLTLSYSATDGSGSGIATTTAAMDGSTTLNGHGLPSGQAINLLIEMTLGPHSFSVQSVDRVTNQGSASVTFTIVVTPESIKQDVNIFLAAGLIKNSGLANSLLAKLSAAADARARGDCATAANIYQAFINELQAQSGTGVDATAAAIMIADAQYLIANCP
jgi:hypothetical protein